MSKVRIESILSAPYDRIYLPYSRHSVLMPENRVEKKRKISWFVPGFH
jgi:hypothetical protein